MVLSFARVFLPNCYVSVKVFDEHNYNINVFVFAFMVCALGGLIGETMYDLKVKREVFRIIFLVLVIIPLEFFVIERMR